jgi:hypothetical protein
MQDTFTYQEILEAQNAVMQLGMISVPTKTAYRLSRIMERLRVATNSITKEKMDLYKKYGTETKEGSGEFKIPDEKLTEFKGIWETFLEQKIDIEYMPIAVNMFPQLPAAAILGMGNFMVEEEKIFTPGR